MSVEEQILGCLAKWRVAPSTQRILDKLREHRASDVETALGALRSANRIAVTNGRWCLTGQVPQFGGAAPRRRKSKAPKPGSAEARTISMWGDES